MDYILAFGSAHRALKAESVLNSRGVPNRIEPAPKTLAQHCDLVISVGADHLKDAIKALKSSRVKVTASYRKEGSVYVKV